MWKRETITGCLGRNSRAFCVQVSPLLLQDESTCLVFFFPVVIIATASLARKGNFNFGLFVLYARNALETN